MQTDGETAGGEAVPGLPDVQAINDAEAAASAGEAAAAQSTGAAAAPPTPPPGGSAGAAAAQATGDGFDFGEAFSIFRGFWDYELFQAGGATVTVSQLVITVIMIAAGIWLCRRVARAIRDALLKRGRIDANTAAIIQNIVLYVMVAILAVASMDMLGIPISALAFLGGAFAIGVGFGAQNLLNNFISGVLLMLERPVRIGDLVEVDDHLGRVEHIGFRCTRVRRTDGIDVLVPNSYLVENSLINWTLIDRRVRTTVSVGVAYGSPTDVVAKLIREACDGHEKILQDPEPIVIFEEFGDNALVFDVYFWANVNSAMELRVIRSDVRFTIDKLFREADLVIAFPQRDVHLDSLSPLEVRMVNADGGSSDN